MSENDQEIEEVTKKYQSLIEEVLNRTITPHPNSYLDYLDNDCVKVEEKIILYLSNKHEDGIDTSNMVFYIS